MTKTGRRRYVSHTRMKRAETTRVRIVGAAIEVFSNRGYDATTMREVATRSGVAIDTVYSVVGRKPLLFAQAVEAVISLEDLPTPLEVRRYLALIREATDSRTLLKLTVGILAEVYRRGDRLFADLEQAPSLDPLLGRLRTSIAQRRAVWLRRIAARLIEVAPSIWDRPVIEDLMHAMLTPGAFRILMRERGWSSDDLVERLTAVLHSAFYPATTI